MNRDYIIKPMSELISNANQVDRIPLSSFNKMIGNPEKVEDFLEIFFTSNASSSIDNILSSLLLNLFILIK